MRKYFDSDYSQCEQLPRLYEVNFKTIKIDSKNHTKVTIDGELVGDVIDDNSIQNDGYRYHDVFHHSFATFLGWSPCTRAMLKRKRKSNVEVDAYEDGARATITEEAISLMIFNAAKNKEYFQNEKKISKALLKQITEMTAAFEVSIRTRKDWENTILKSYYLFRLLVENNGGKIKFDMYNQTAIYFKQ